MSATASDEAPLLAALRAGDERAFAALVDRHTPGMRRLALGFVRSHAVADEVVQEAWLGALRGLDRFEGRSSLSTWLYRICANVAKTRAEREGRTVPFSDLAGETGADEPAVEPERFQGPDGRYPGHWATFPASWPEQRLLAGETRELLAAAIEALPPAQRLVLSLRDVEGWDAEEVCNVLDLSETNQRVLLHRARSKMRAALEAYLEGDRS